MYYLLFLGSIHVLLHEFMPYWKLESTKAVTRHCAKMGGGID